MGFINIVTEIPGPRSRALTARMDRALPRSISPAVPVVVDRAHGALLTDVDGNSFIDLAGGLGSLNVGHTHPKVVEAIKRQAERFTHTDFSLLPYEGYVELAEALAGRAPVRARRKTIFFNSGAEAIENAVKIAKRATGRSAVIAFEGAFHGRTLMALSLTSRVIPYKQGFGPFAPEVYHAPFPDVYRHPRPERAADEALDALARMFSSQVDPDQVAAIVVEPVQGEGGFVVPPVPFMQGLREIADRYRIVLIIDEIQTGYGRTGHFFALEHFNIEADLMTVGKSIAAGLPLSAVVGRQDLMDAVPSGGLGGTTIGNPIACSAGLAVLEVMAEEGVLERAREIGRHLSSTLEEIAGKTPLIGDVRGLGAMVAAELVKDRSTKEPAGELTSRAAAAMVQRGVVMATAGIHGQVLRFLTPLVITDKQLEEALEVVGDSLFNLALSNRA